jgi:hypothetical protein
MTNSYSGNYPIESRAGEIERLHVQSAAMAPDTVTMLSLIGAREGWSRHDYSVDVLGGATGAE